MFASLKIKERVTLPLTGSTGSDPVFEKQTRTRTRTRILPQTRTRTRLGPGYPCATLIHVQLYRVAHNSRPIGKININQHACMNRS